MKRVFKIFSVIVVIAIIGILSLINLNAAQTPNSILTRDIPSFASSGNASTANDKDYSTIWEGEIPGWLAYNISSFPDENKSKVILAWYNNYTYNYASDVLNSDSYNCPKNYTIEVNDSKNDDVPIDNWKTITTINNNVYHSRQHVLNLTGYNWIRINISEISSVGSQTASINMDIHSTVNGIQDNFIFYGDSITAGGMNLYGDGEGTFSQIINKELPEFFPVAECGGIANVSSSDGAKHINKWLDIFPGKYVALAYGTNDAKSNIGTELFYSNLKVMVEAVIEADKIPIVPKIPWSNLTDIQNTIPNYNKQIDKIYANYPEVIPGPNFWTFFKNNSDLISSDGIHPNYEGYNALKKMWADSIIVQIYSTKTDENREKLTPIVTASINKPNTTQETFSPNETTKIDSTSNNTKPISTIVPSDTPTKKPTQINKYSNNAFYNYWLKIIRKFF